MIYDLIIIGGGVSGIALSKIYKDKNPNKKFLILEHNDSLLKKLAVTGNGKCNFTNEFLSKDSYNNGDSFSLLFKNNPIFRILSFYESLNINYVKDDEGRYYPYSKSAKNVRLKFLSHLTQDEYKLNIQISDILLEKGMYKIISNDDAFYSKQIVFSVGNINYKSLGSDGSMFDIIRKFGHTFTNLYPSNIYIKIVEKSYTKEISGLRTISSLSLYNNEQEYYKELGEVLFKDDAVSGIVSFNVSNRLSNLYKLDKVINPYLKIDFVPDYSINLLTNLLSKSKSKEDFLLSFVHEKIAKLLNRISKTDIELINNLKSFKLNVLSLGDFDNAQITSGGINSNELSSSLESKFNKNMYFIGDILDIDAPCGGYNLSLALLSAMKVGDVLE